MWITNRDIWDRLRTLELQLGGVQWTVDSLSASMRQMRVWLLPIRELGVTFSGGPDMRIKFGIVLPEKPGSEADWAEITGGELTVTIGGVADPVVVATTKEQQEAVGRLVTDDRFLGDQDAACRAEFVYLDNATPANKSKTPATLDFVLVDTVPPADPTALGATMLEELL